MNGQCLPVGTSLVVGLEVEPESDGTSEHVEVQKALGDCCVGSELDSENAVLTQKAVSLSQHRLFSFWLRRHRLVQSTLMGGFAVVAAYVDLATTISCPESNVVVEKGRCENVEALECEGSTNGSDDFGCKTPSERRRTRSTLRITDYGV